MLRDTIKYMVQTLVKYGVITEEMYQKIDAEQKDIAVAAMKFAEDSAWPDPIHLEEDVFAP